MKTRATKRFWKLYDALPPQEQDRARKAFRLWMADPRHPSLRFKRVGQNEPVYSVRISDSIRALGLHEADAMVWFWIGNHDAYDRLLDQF